jgi:hypothetical protein
LPEAAKLRWNVPELWLPDPGEPSSKTTLCVTPPGLQNQVTVVPTGTEKEVGLKKLLPT